MDIDQLLEETEDLFVEESEIDIKYIDIDALFNDH
ncbi:hypothetical protein JOC86_000337 [Bacillus pakistanensis]|uniref:Uncharacterized protein n=1 Tax=Rossellomorea pakistanensis TaxID=992288 RepID=A0ABS2N7M6_9BACI|nr:hypothetical protein [Bacillus pakistanensis]